jgi:hypothetical protein
MAVAWQEEERKQKDGHIDRQTNRQTNWLADRQKDRKIERQKDIKTKIEKVRLVSF